MLYCDTAAANTTHTMSQQPHPFDTKYNLVINEQQRAVIERALAGYISDGFNDETGEFGENTAESLFDMVNPEGSTGPLVPVPGVNGLVV